MVTEFTRTLIYCIVLLGLMTIVLGCTLAVSATETPMPPTATATPTNEALVETWQTIMPGLEMRIYVPEGNVIGQLLVLRIDPALYTFRVHYHPGEPLNTSGWRNELPDAAAFVNTNFFDRQYYILGLLVADSVVYGTSYTDRGGTFAIQDGQPSLTSNIETPYQGEVFEQAVQAFPMLVFENAQAYTTTRGDRPTRRTVIAQDAQGRILLIATPLLGQRLADLAAYLLTTDMEIVSALNLDGGRSTMMVVQADTPYAVNSFDLVPAVLAVYAR